MDNPTICNVREEDLRDLTRIRALFEEAIRLKIVERSERDELRFISLAMHALRKANNPAAMFASNLFHRRWHYAANVDEDHAIQLMKTGQCPKIVPDRRRGRFRK